MDVSLGGSFTPILTGYDWMSRVSFVQQLTSIFWRSTDTLHLQMTPHMCARVINKKRGETHRTLNFRILLKGVYLYTMGPQNLHVFEVFMANNLIFTWPKPGFFHGWKGGANMAYLLELAFFFGCTLVGWSPPQVAWLAPTQVPTIGTTGKLDRKDPPFKGGWWPWNLYGFFFGEDLMSLC